MNALIEKGIVLILEKIKEDYNVSSFINTYLTNYFNKHTKTKTFLHGGKNLDFEEIYYPLSIEPMYSEGEEIKNANDLYREDADNYITIIGDAGSGKSTFVKNMFMDVIRKQKGIPFLLELRYLKNHDSIDDYIRKEIVKDDAIYQSLISHFKDGEWIFFLDGFDELQKDTKLEILSTFIDFYPNNKFILTSRPSSNAEKIERFENYKLLPLEDEDVINFAKTQLKFIEERNEIEDRLINSLNDGLQSDTIKTFLANPLLLSIYILTFQKSPDIPKTKNLFYRRVLDALVYQHDAETKPGFIRNKKCDLDQDNLEKVLRKFSYSTYMKDIYVWENQELQSNLIEVKKSLDIDFQPRNFMDDMTEAYTLWTEDDGEYAFSHRSFQEFFACHYIKENKEKKKIYEGLLNQFDKEGSRKEIDNLLSLLEEIDEECFIENFKMPLFKKIDDLLKNNAKQFLEEYVCYLHYFGLPKQILDDYKPCIDIIDENFEKNVIDYYKLLSIVIGIGIGMRMRMGSGSGRGIKVGMEREMVMEMRREMAMAMDMDMDRGIETRMRMGIGIEIGIEMEMKREMEREMKREMEREMERERQMKMEEEEEEETEIKINRELSLKIFKSLVQEIKKINDDGINTKLIDTPNNVCCFMGYLLVVTKDISHSIHYPLVQFYRVIHLFRILTQSQCIKKLMDYMQTNKNKWLSLDDIPAEILSELVFQIETEYKEYKEFITSEIKKSEKKLEKYNASNEADIFLL